MDSGSFIATIVGSSAIILGALAKLNHKRLRSKCCGEEKVISVDIDDTSPKKAEPIVVQPKEPESK
jgi:hypothetical protein